MNTTACVEYEESDPVNSMARYRLYTGPSAFPDKVKERLSKLSLKEQAELFSLEKCRTTTYFIDYRTLETSKLLTYHGEAIRFMEKYPLIIQDHCIVGIYMPDTGEELFWFLHPCSRVVSFNGHRTDAEFGYREEHEWYTFRYLNIIKIDGTPTDFLTKEQYEQLNGLTLEKQKKYFIVRWEHEQKELSSGDFLGGFPLRY